MSTTPQAEERTPMERLGLASAITGLALLSAAFVVGLAAPRDEHVETASWRAPGDR